MKLTQTHHKTKSGIVRHNPRRNLYKLGWRDRDGKYHVVSFWAKSHLDENVKDLLKAGIVPYAWKVGESEKVVLDRHRKLVDKASLMMPSLKYTASQHDLGGAFYRGLKGVR